MQLKTSHLLWGVVALAVLGNGDRIAGTVETSSLQQTIKSEASTDRKLLRQQARETKKLSKIALDRAKAGCIQIFEKKTGKEHYFGNGSTVVDPNTGYQLQEGVVCNRLGLTGVVVNGYITDLVMVAPEQKIEYLGYLALQNGEQQ
ncbi:MAG: hypothetical protein AAF572_28730 [Cyanobacteria bacterium P01_B01_bin.77]